MTNSLLTIALLLPQTQVTEVRWPSVSIAFISMYFRHAVTTLE